MKIAPKLATSFLITLMSKLPASDVSKVSYALPRMRQMMEMKTDVKGGHLCHA